MKRLVFLIVLTLITLTITCCMADTYYVTTDIDALNVRNAEDHDNILGVIRAGKSINVDYIKGDWAHFTFKGQSAVVYKDYLTSDLTKSNNSQNGTITYKKGSTGKRKEISTDEASMIFTVSYNVKTFINARASKSKDGTILGKLYPGDEVYVIKHGDNWSRIIFDGGIAYVQSQYIEPERINLPEEGLLYKVSVKEGTTLKVRVGPSKKKKVITTLSNGAFVKVLDDDGEWSDIFYTMKDRGYVMNKFIIPVN